MMQKKRNIQLKLGLTVLECLFAMSIMLVGLVGIAAMVPFAGRQAADSYGVVQSLSMGDNTLELASSNQIFRPSLRTPWQVINDEIATRGDSVATAFVSIEKLYQDRYQNVLFPVSGNRVLAANEALGTSVCLDPGFWGEQYHTSKLSSTAWGNIRRNRFPFYNEAFPVNLSPFGTGATQITPRLLRISIQDPLGPNSGGNGGWLRTDASRKLARTSDGDVVDLRPEIDQSSSALRQFIFGQNASADVNSQGALISSSTGSQEGARGSWLATIVPADETPIVDPNAVALTTSLPIIPERFDMSVVVFGKRDVRELSINSSTIALDEAPKSERLANVNFLLPSEAMSSGAFDVELTNFAEYDISLDRIVGPKLRVGDWLMLSRFKQHYVQLAIGAPLQPRNLRQQHSWYRVVSVGEEEIASATQTVIQVRVAGQPWGWSFSELDSFKEALVPVPASLPMSTVATLVPNVINVYQRTLTFTAN